MPKKVKEVILFGNGNTIVSGESKNQISGLQKSWFLLYIQFLKSKGVKNLDKILFRFPNNRTAKYLPKYDNWSFEENA